MRESSYSIGIHRILKLKHSELQITNAALLLINNMIMWLAYKLIRASNKISNLVNNKLLSIDDVATAVKIVVNDELAKHSINEGRKAITKYKNLINNSKTKVAKEKYAELQLKICTTHSFIQKNIDKNKSAYDDTGVFLTAVLEYIVEEILEISGNITRDNSRKQITPRDIFMGVRKDYEFNKIYNGYMLGTGVVPYIYPKLVGGDGNRGKNKDNIYRITKPGLKRLMYRAGVKYISGLVYEDSRNILKGFVEKIVSNSIVLAERKKHTTIMYEDGIEVLNLLNISVYNVKGYPGTMAPCKGSEKVSKLFPEKANVSGKKRIRRPKTNLLRIISKYQNTACTLLPHSSVERLIREIGEDYSEKITRYEVNYMWLVHAIVEDYMVNLYRNSLLLALHANRLTIMPKDMILVHTIQSLINHRTIDVI